MKVLYDPQIFCTQKYGGISKYFIEIMKYADFEYQIPFLSPFIKHEEFLSKYNKTISNINKVSKLHGLLYRINLINKSNQIVINKTNNQFKPDIYHATSKMYNINSPIKKVVTIHDFTLEIYSNLFQTEKEKLKLKKMKIEQEKQLFNSDKIITISQNTKKDLLRLYPTIPNEKISVIYHGGIDTNNTEKTTLPDNFILFVGARSYYKNFYILLDAFSEIAKEHTDIKLVCVGGGYLTEKELDICKQKGIIERIIVLQHISNNKLNYIYQKAKLFVFPSLYEGFGIPILEAFENNCPVVLSDSSCFPEIAKDAALYFNDNNVEELKCQIEKLLFDDVMKKKQIELGILRARDFSWKKSAQEHSKVYQSLV